MDTGKSGNPPYDRMYHILCTAASRALDLLPPTSNTETARELLQGALYEAEELYIEAEE